MECFELAVPEIFLSYAPTFFGMLWTRAFLLLMFVNSFIICFSSNDEI